MVIGHDQELVVCPGHNNAGAGRCRFFRIGLAKELGRLCEVIIDRYDGRHDIGRDLCHACVHCLRAVHRQQGRSGVCALLRLILGRFRSRRLLLCLGGSLIFFCLRFFHGLGGSGRPGGIIAGAPYTGAYRNSEYSRECQRKNRLSFAAFFTGFFSGGLTGSGAAGSVLRIRAVCRPAAGCLLTGVAAAGIIKVLLLRIIIGIVLIKPVAGAAVLIAAVAGLAGIRTGIAAAVPFRRLLVGISARVRGVPFVV